MIALLIQTNLLSLVKSHKSRLGLGIWRIPYSGESDLFAIVNPPDKPNDVLSYPLKENPRFTGPCEVCIVVENAKNERIDLFAERVT